MKVAWLLNLDADDELANPKHAPNSPEAAARIRSFGVRTNLAIDGDVVIEEGVRADGIEGRAWMPTPRALAAIEASGATVPRAPPLEVLQRVNHRAFAMNLGPILEGAMFTESTDEALAALERSTDGGYWLMKTAHGFAGRGRRLVHAGRTGPDVRGFLAGSMRRAGGLAIEPWIARNADYAIHGFIGDAGEHVLGEPTTQRCDDAGVWRETKLAEPGELSAIERTELLETAARVARALNSAGYFGPFGVDAFRYVDAEGRTQFHPLCEINARYTMGYAIGMGSRRPDR